MAVHPLGSITQWVRDLECGDSRDAPSHLWARYAARLVRLARATLSRKHAARSVVDEEDAALQAFHITCRGVADGRYPLLGHRDELWRVLARITVRQALTQARDQQRLKRGGKGASLRSNESLLAQIESRESDPVDTLILADAYLERLELLDGEMRLREVAEMRMAGCSNQEIADRLGCGLRTVERKLSLIRGLLSNLFDSPDLVPVPDS